MRISKKQLRKMILKEMSMSSMPAGFDFNQRNAGGDLAGMYFDIVAIQDAFMTFMIEQGGGYDFDEQYYSYYDYVDQIKEKLSAVELAIETQIGDENFDYDYHPDHYIPPNPNEISVLVEEALGHVSMGYGAPDEEKQKASAAALGLEYVEPFTYR